MADLFVKAPKDKRTNLNDLFKHVVDSMRNAGTPATAPADMVNLLVKYQPNLVKVQGDDPATPGNQLVFATSAGIAKLYPESGAASEQAAGAAVGSTAPQFVIESDIPIPEVKRGGGGGLREETYPFSKMDVGKSIFIPKTAERPDPFKSLAGTIASANRRYAKTYPMTTGRDKQPHPKAGQPTGKDGRKFLIRPRNLAEHKEEGARIWRTQ